MAYDAHVKARRALVSRIARDVSAPPAAAREAAAAALAAFRWPPIWGQKMLTAYGADGLTIGVEVVGVCKNVPAHLVRALVRAARVCAGKP